MLSLSALVLAAYLLPGSCINSATQPHRVEVQGDGSVSPAASSIASAAIVVRGNRSKRLASAHLAANGRARVEVARDLGGARGGAGSPAAGAAAEPGHEPPALHPGVPRSAGRAPPLPLPVVEGAALSLLVTRAKTQIFGLGLVFDIVIIALIVLVALFFLWGGTTASFIDNPLGALQGTVEEARERFKDGVQAEDFTPGPRQQTVGQRIRQSSQHTCC
mmetsp:Transcript_9410/g.29842  ORF Transcript_9410/g.29842 Transcript_9410/m.29842 type:complete len:219 (+) Transcript_9410:51-707(+)